MKTLCAIDFDGTVTTCDVVDELLRRYAKGKDWTRAEEAWRKGEIASDICLTRQLASVRLSDAELKKFLKAIPLDPGFSLLVNFLRRKKIPLVILSDGFDLFIRKILSAKGFSRIPFRSNRLLHRSGALDPEFPYKNGCRRCAHCKKDALRALRTKAQRIVFIGDGLSDVCALENADHVFAKGKLAAHCREEGIAFRHFRNLGDVRKALDLEPS